MKKEVKGLVFFIEGQAVPKERPRFGRSKKGKMFVHSGKKSRAYESRVGWTAFAAARESKGWVKAMMPISIVKPDKVGCAVPLIRDTNETALLSKFRRMANEIGEETGI